MDFHTLLAAFSLLVSLLCFAYVVHKYRRMRRDMAELKHSHTVGLDAYIAEQMQKWVNGEIHSRTKKMDVTGDKLVEVIEPISGWEIVVSTTRRGKTRCCGLSPDLRNRKH